LAKRLKVEPEAVAMEPSTLLGDWYANLVHVGRQQLVLAVSESTLLPAVVLAAPNTTVVPRLRLALRHLLALLGVPRDTIEREVAAMAEVTYAKTASKQVLGVMVDFARLLPHFLNGGDSLLGASMRLARTPCSPLYKTHTSPDRATAAAFGVRLVRIVD
jgi:hypothetical protein